jgi:hypothetical protein
MMTIHNKICFTLELKLPPKKLQNPLASRVHPMMRPTLAALCLNFPPWTPRIQGQLSILVDWQALINIIIAIGKTPI